MVVAIESTVRKPTTVQGNIHLRLKKESEDIDPEMLQKLRLNILLTENSHCDRDIIRQRFIDESHIFFPFCINVFPFKEEGKRKIGYIVILGGDTHDLSIHIEQGELEMAFCNS